MFVRRATQARFGFVLGFSGEGSSRADWCVMSLKCVKQGVKVKMLADKVEQQLRLGSLGERPISAVSHRDSRCGSKGTARIGWSRFKVQFPRAQHNWRNIAIALIEMAFSERAL